ncbi:hypothetical protein PVIIG_05848 [Plasmodium vivax India VII]|uniref:Variable surface protein Vir7-like protein n=1 Tax=Plasmodium vivax India VII TaxID=1077284 RepID=A0A0J9S3Y0_PLAVI|nr:hypothetical protein PVIIG_05848 [Plasmodium vivax India VII]
MSNFLGKTALSNLRTKYYYGSLEKGYDNCQNEPFYNEAKERLKDYNWLHDVSEQILKGLCYVYRNRFKDDFQSDICKFLYFWLGSILIDRMTHNTVFFDVINDLFKTLKTNNIEKICELPHYYINVNNFKHIKFFFDYSEDYTSYKHQFTGYNHTCNREYKTYLDTYVNSYKNVRDECAKNPNLNSYCEEFNQYFKDKYDYDLSNWKCVLDEHGHEEEELEEDNVAQDPLLTPVPGMGVHSATSQNEVSSVTGQEDHGPVYSGYPSRDITTDLNIISDPSEDSSPSTIKKSITSAASAAGLLVPPFLIYNVISIVIVQQDVLFYI